MKLRRRLSLLLKKASGAATVTLTRLPAWTTSAVALAVDGGQASQTLNLNQYIRRRGSPPAAITQTSTTGSGLSNISLNSASATLSYDIDHVSADSTFAIQLQLAGGGSITFTWNITSTAVAPSWINTDTVNLGTVTSGTAFSVDISSYVDNPGSPAATLASWTQTFTSVGNDDGTISVNGFILSGTFPTLDIGADDVTAYIHITSFQNAVGTAQGNKRFEWTVEAPVASAPAWHNTDTVNLGSFAQGSAYSVDLASYISTLGNPEATWDNNDFNTDFIGNGDATINRNGTVLSGTFPTLDLGDSNVTMYSTWRLFNSEGDAGSKRFEWTVEAPVATAPAWTQSGTVTVGTVSSGDTLSFDFSSYISTLGLPEATISAPFSNFASSGNPTGSLTVDTSTQSLSGTFPTYTTDTTAYVTINLNNASGASNLRFQWTVEASTDRAPSWLNANNVNLGSVASGSAYNIDIETYLSDLGSPEATTATVATGTFSTIGNGDATQSISGFVISGNLPTLNIGDSNITAQFTVSVSNSSGSSGAKTFFWTVTAPVQTNVAPAWTNTDTVNLGTFASGASVSVDLSSYLSEAGTPTAYVFATTHTFDSVGNSDGTLSHSGITFSGTLPTLDVGDANVTASFTTILSNSVGNTGGKTFQWTVTPPAASNIAPSWTSDTDLGKLLENTSHTIELNDYLSEAGTPTATISAGTHNFPSIPDTGWSATLSGTTVTLVIPDIITSSTEGYIEFVATNSEGSATVQLTFTGNLAQRPLLPSTIGTQQIQEQTAFTYDLNPHVQNYGVPRGEWSIELKNWPDSANIAVSQEGIFSGTTPDVTQDTTYYARFQLENDSGSDLMLLRHRVLSQTQPSTLHGPLEAFSTPPAQAVALGETWTLDLTPYLPATFGDAQDSLIALDGSVNADNVWTYTPTAVGTEDLAILARRGTPSTLRLLVIQLQVGNPPAWHTETLSAQTLHALQSDATVINYGEEITGEDVTVSVTGGTYAMINNHANTLTLDPAAIPTGTTGDQTLTLTATNAFGSDTVTMSVNIPVVLAQWNITNDGSQVTYDLATAATNAGITTAQTNWQFTLSVAGTFTFSNQTITLTPPSGTEAIDTVLITTDTHTFVLRIVVGSAPDFTTTSQHFTQNVGTHVSVDLTAYVSRGYPSGTIALWSGDNPTSGPFENLVIDSDAGTVDFDIPLTAEAGSVNLIILQISNNFGVGTLFQLTVVSRALHTFTDTFAMRRGMSQTFDVDAAATAAGISGLSGWQFESTPGDAYTLSSAGVLTADLPMWTPALGNIVINAPAYQFTLPTTLQHYRVSDAGFNVQMFASLFRSYDGAARNLFTLRRVDANGDSLGTNPDLIIRSGSDGIADLSMVSSHVSAYTEALLVVINCYNQDSGNVVMNMINTANLNPYGHLFAWKTGGAIHYAVPQGRGMRRVWNANDILGSGTAGINSRITMTSSLSWASDTYFAIGMLVQRRATSGAERSINIGDGNTDPAIRNKSQGYDYRAHDYNPVVNTLSGETEWLYIFAADMRTETNNNRQRDLEIYSLDSDNIWRDRHTLAGIGVTTLTAGMRVRWWDYHIAEIGFWELSQNTTPTQWRDAQLEIAKSALAIWREREEAWSVN